MKAMLIHSRKASAKVAIPRNYAIRTQSDNDVLQHANLSRVTGLNIAAPLPNSYAIPGGYGEGIATVLYYSMGTLLLVRQCGCHVVLASMSGKPVPGLLTQFHLPRAP